MLANLEINAYEKLVRFLSGAESVESLRAWWDENTWDCNIADSDLLGSVELALDEYSSGDRTPKELTEALTSALSNTKILHANPIVSGNLGFYIATSGTNGFKLMGSIVPAGSTPPGQSFGKLREMEHA